MAASGVLVLNTTLRHPQIAGTPLMSWPNIKPFNYHSVSERFHEELG
jgi:hypothetical protein